MEMRQSVEVRVPREVAFAFFSDPSRAFATAPELRFTWDGPIQAGTGFHFDSRDAMDSCDGVVESYDAPGHIALRMWSRDHPERAGSVAVDFASTEAGTRVEALVATEMNHSLQLAAAILRPWLAWQSRRGMKRLVGILEAEHRAGSGSPA